MDRINGAGHVNRRFVSEDSGTNRPPTEITDAWLNGIQEELCAVIGAAGIVLDVNNTVQLLAALRASGVFQTPAQFDSSTRAATTEFCQRAAGNMQSTLYVASTTLAAADAGKAVLLATAGTVVTLPLLSTVRNGTVFKLANVTSNGNGTVQRQGGDLIYFGANSVASCALNGGETLDLVAHSTGWVAIGGSVALAYASSSFGSLLTPTGHQKLPSGLIIQWGQTGNIPAGGSQSILFSTSFLTSVFALAFGNAYTAGGSSVSASIGATFSGATNGFTAFNQGTSNNNAAGWIAVGR